MPSLALLCGGKSGRMGQDKALMPFLGRPLILRILERLSSEMEDVFISTNHPAEFAFLNLPVFPDLIPDQGALGGLFTIFNVAQNPLISAVACDMPFANPALFAYEADLLSMTGADLVIPSTQHGLEPLHAVYRRETCLPVIQSALQAGMLKLTSWLPQVMVRTISPEEVIRFDPHGLAFWNLNTLDDFYQAEEQARLLEN